MRVFLILAPAVVAALAPALWHDPFRTYIRSPDPDLIFAYQALALNDGDSRINAEHTGYIYFVLLAWTLRAARALGFITADHIGAMAGLDEAAFDISFAQVIFAGRILSMAEAIAFIGLVFWGVRSMTGALLPAALAALLTAGSLGISIQASLLRTELLSASFVFAVFFSLCIAARRRCAMNGVWMAAAGACAALAMATKVQAIFPLLAVPILTMSLGTTPPPDTSASSANERNLVVALFMLLAALATLPAAAMLVSGIVERGSSGLYQSAILVYIVGALVLYRTLYPMPAASWLLGSSVFVLGFSSGLLVHLLYPNPAATDAIAAFIEHMKVYSHVRIAESAGIPVAAIIETLREAANQAFIRRMNLAPLVLLEIAILGGAIGAWHARDRQTAVGAFGMLVTALWLEIMFGTRGLNTEYLVYIDPWRAIAFALVFHSFATRLVPKRRRVAAAVAIAVVLAIDMSHLSHALAASFIRYQPVSDACGQAKGYLPKLAHQFAKFCA